MAASLEDYQSFQLDKLMTSNSEIAALRSIIIMRKVKFTTRLPIGRAKQHRVRLGSCISGDGHPQRTSNGVMAARSSIGAADVRIGQKLRYCGQSFKITEAGSEWPRRKASCGDRRIPPQMSTRNGVVPTRCLQLQVLLYGIIGGVLAARAGRNPRSRSLALSANRRVPHHRHE